MNFIIFVALAATTPGSAATDAVAFPRIDALPMIHHGTERFDGPAPVAAAADTGRLLVGWPDHFDVFDLTTGARAWGLPIAATRIACDDGLCVVADETDVRGIDLNSHTVRWQQRLAAPLGTTPTLRSGWVLLASATGRVRAVQAADGREVWTYDAGSAIVGQPAINGTRVAISTAARTVVLLDLITGRPLWAVRVDSAPAAPCLGGGAVIFGTADGRLITLDDRDGRLRFEYRLGATLTGAPTLDEAHIYAVGLDGVLRAFDRGNGAQRWYKNLETRAAIGPVVDGNLVVVVLRSGVVDVRLSDGRVAGHFASPGPVTTLRLPVPPIVAGAGRELAVLTVSSDVSTTDAWSLTRITGGARLATATWPSALPGLPLTLTPPR